jgi:ABC-type transport system involved in multi-copper enzyme maturation permease subunit
MGMRQWLSSGLDSVGRAVVARAGGPILDKELRVAGRRRLGYLLRVAYVAVMAVFVVGAWWSQMGQLHVRPLEMASRMAEVGRSTILSLLWFQFFALQILATVLLAGSIGDEVVRRTLDVLLSTPITALQIVAGKLASRLLHLALLAALSLPVMLVVRVLGGVNTDAVLAGIGTTLTATLLCASLSLYFSAGDRRAWFVVTKVAAVWLAVFAVVPLIVALVLALGGGGGPGMGCMECLAYLNPFIAMFTVSENLMMSGRGPMSFTFLWPLHCGFMLLVSAALCAGTVRRVTRVALQKMIAPRHGASSGAAGPASSDAWVAAQLGRRMVDMGAVRRVTGAPMIWKELRHRVFSNRAVGCILMAAVTVVLLGIYFLLGCVDGRAFTTPGVHISFAIIFVLLAGSGMTILAAVPIAAEKEARTWGTLLTTPLSERSILFGKAMGVWRRGLPAWYPLMAHLALFCFCGLINPLAVIHVGIIVCGIVAAVTGTGLFFSAVMKTGTRAVLANMALHGFLGLGTLMALAAVANTMRLSYGRSLVDWLMDINPLVQIAVVMERSGREAWTKLTYSWPSSGGEESGLAVTTAIVCFAALANILIGLLFAKMAAWWIRHEKT